MNEEAATRGETQDKSKKVAEEDPAYLCANCGKEIKLTAKMNLRCNQCGFMIFFKKRTRRPIVFDCV